MSALLGLGYFCAEYLLSSGNFGGLPFFLLYGLPVAFAVTWLIAGPVLWWLVRRPVSWIGAACWGGAIAGLMALVGFALKSLFRWRASVNPNFHYQLGGGEFVRAVDGVLTPYGWWVELGDTLKFVLIGIAVAVVVRALIGEGENAK